MVLLIAMATMARTGSGRLGSDVPRASAATGPRPAASPAASQSVVSTDFNGDGYADLAIGVPHEDIGTAYAAGGVNVLYGSAAGLSSPGNQFWNQDSPGIDDDPEYGDLFGRSLAPADFNADGYADLAIGVLGESVGTVVSAGAVEVLYGSASGLTATGSQLWSQDSTDILDQADTYDRFGRDVETGDYNGDGYADLAIGVPFEDNGGALNVIYGSAAGLTATGNQFWNQDSPGILEREDPGDRFAWQLAGFDFNGDGYDDLAIGATGETVTVTRQGAVNVIYGSAAGLSSAGNQLWTQDSPGILNQGDAGDFFGRSVGGGDFNGDGYADLSVGVPNEDVSGFDAAGAVNVIYGSAAGLTDVGNQFWNQDSPGILDQAERSDRFGRYVGSGDYNADGYDELAVGAVDETLSGAGVAGAVNLIDGSAAGLTDVGNQFWNQDSPGIPGDPEKGDHFGRSNVGIDFNSDGYPDMAVGASGDMCGLLDNAGSVTVILGSAAGLTSTGAVLWNQDSPGILDQCDANDYFGASLPGTPGGGTPE